MIKAILIDDEIKALEVLQMEIELYCPDVAIIGTARKVDQAIKLYQQTKPDIIFLDIEMPEKNGFDFINAIENLKAKIVFTTAYDQFAIKAIRFSAFDYLLKPISGEDLVKLMTRYKSESKEISNMQMQLLFQQLAESPVDRIALSTSDGVEIVYLKEIIYCEAQSNYTMFYLEKQRKILVSKTLKEFEDLLIKDKFMRIHQSYLVNLDKLIRYEKEDGGQLRLVENHTVPVSNSRKRNLMNYLNSLTR